MPSSVLRINWQGKMFRRKQDPIIYTQCQIGGFRRCREWRALKWNYEEFEFNFTGDSQRKQLLGSHEKKEAEKASDALARKPLRWTGFE